MHDLAVVIVSANDAEWLPACLTTLEAARGDVSMEVFVVDNGSTDGTREVVEEGFPDVTVLPAENRGFAAGNNRALPHCFARHVLFLNPDTEIREGSLAVLVAAMDRSTEVGLLGCRHRIPDGEVQRTMRRFPSPARVWGEALAANRIPFGLARKLGELVVEESAYAEETDCDWLAGSFMLVRWEALAGAGYMDERFFLYSEETDFCLRISESGWKVRYSPRMTIMHHAGKAGVNPRLLAQSAYARRQYAAKHFGPLRRRLFRAGLASYYAIRTLAGLGPRSMRRRHAAAWRCLAVSLGLRGSPFPELTNVSVHPLEGPIEGASRPRADRVIRR